MSRGLLTGGQRHAVVLGVACGFLMLACLAGCGKGDQEEPVTQQKPPPMVPGAALDSALVDTVVTADTESAYEAGTLPVAKGVRDDSSVPEQAAVPAVEEIKAAPAATKTASAASVARPSTTVSTGDGSYGLQLGSFTNLANARKQVERLSALGYAPVIEESDLGGQTYHRVMLRGVGDMAEASRLGEYIHSELGIAYLVRRGN
jgi:cell division septation protein DedD